MENGNLIAEIKTRLDAIESEVAELKRLVEEWEPTPAEPHVMPCEAGASQDVSDISVKKVDGRLISDLRKAIGLNDRIRFQKELFGGDAALMNSTIEALNEASSFVEALEYIASSFSWDDENATVKYFKDILSRKAY